jgi:hypothetical protein
MTYDMIGFGFLAVLLALGMRWALRAPVAPRGCLPSVCAWCGKILLRARRGYDGPVSHGICRECGVKWYGEKE